MSITRRARSVLVTLALAAAAVACDGAGASSGDTLPAASTDGTTTDGTASDATATSAASEATASPATPPHRPEATACEVPEERSSPCEGDGDGECQLNSDCAGVGATCVREVTSPDRHSCVCQVPECTSDVDCGGTDVCACGRGHDDCIGNSCRNTCVDSGCRVDADCGDDGWCSPSTDGYGSVSTYRCHLDGGVEDACLVAEDCEPFDTCTWQAGTWGCTSTAPM